MGEHGVGGVGAGPRRPKGDIDIGHALQLEPETGNHLAETRARVTAKAAYQARQRPIVPGPVTGKELENPVDEDGAETGGGMAGEVLLIEDEAYHGNQSKEVWPHEYRCRYNVYHVIRTDSGSPSGPQAMPYE